MTRAAVPLLILLVACSDEPAAPSTIVIGLQAQPAVTSMASSFRLTTTMMGRTEARVTNELPRELTLDGRGPLSIAIEGLDREGNVIVSRAAATEFVPNERKLLRVGIDARCLTLPLFTPVVCSADETCRGGECVAKAIAPSDLETYSDVWPNELPRSCLQARGAAPRITLGTGEFDHSDLTSVPLEPERGPQGGHHLWLSVRMRNLDIARSTTSITAIQPETGLVAPPMSVLFVYSPEEAGTCKLTGLRYQLDGNGASINDFLGKPLDVTIEVRDPSGVSVTSTSRIQVANRVR